MSDYAGAVFVRSNVVFWHYLYRRIRRCLNGYKLIVSITLKPGQPWKTAI